MKRFVLLLLLFKISASSFCQTSYNKLESQLKFLYKNDVAITNPKDIFINKFNKSIDIVGHQILLDSIKITYFYDRDAKPSYQNQVYFECKNSNCIRNNIENKDFSGVTVPFKTKASCYRFINLLSEIKQLMDNH